MTTECTSKKESTIETAMNRLFNAIGSTKETVGRFEARLSSVVTAPEKPTEGTPETAVTQTALESRLIEMTAEISGINNYLLELQNRIQL